MNIYNKIRNVFKKKRKFIVTKTWFVDADNTQEAIIISNKKEPSWMDVRPNLGDNNDDKT
jgi:hypothetical protein